MQIENRIQQYRKQRRLSQQQLATQINVARQTIIAIEKQQSIPSVQIALQLAQLFDCRVEDLFCLQSSR